MNNTARKRVTQEYYARRSKDYDQQKSRTWQSSQGFGTEVINSLLDALTYLENKHLLEIGIGSGRVAFPLLKGTKSWFIGLDLSKEMLTLAKAKMLPHKQSLDLVLGDGDYLPFVDNAFDAIICISAMHYFESTEKTLEEISTTLKEDGILIYGDLTLHESDDKGFFEKLERILSAAHAKYCKPSEVEKLLRTRGFRVLEMKTIPYRKSFRSLLEDKGEYFNVTTKMLGEHLKRASAETREQYDLTDTDLTQFFTIITASKKTERR